MLVLFNMIKGFNVPCLNAMELLKINNINIGFRVRKDKNNQNGKFMGIRGGLVLSRCMIKTINLFN